MSTRFTGRVNKREEALHNLELARRQRLLPVQCWERQWVTPTGALPGSTYKVFKWMKTPKVQEFSDDEAMTDADEQQQPLRDEMEALAGAADQEVEEQEAAERNAAGEGDESRMGSEDPADKSKRPSALPEGLNTGDVTPAETGTTPMPGSPPQTKPE